MRPEIQAGKVRNTHPAHARCLQGFNVSRRRPLRLNEINRICHKLSMCSILKLDQPTLNNWRNAHLQVTFARYFCESSLQNSAHPFRQRQLRAWRAHRWHHQPREHNRLISKITQRLQMLCAYCHPETGDF